MFDRLVRTSASWDWVTPLMTLVQNWHFRPSTRFQVPFGSGYSGWELKVYLKQKGIRVWGLMVVGDSITFRVRSAQAGFAKYSLSELGVPYTGGYVNEVKSKNTSISKEPNPILETPAQRKLSPPANLLDTLNHFINRLAERADEIAK